MTIDFFQRPELLCKTARYRRIGTLDRVYEGRQYDGRPNWWTGQHKPGDKEVPLRERKPCVIYKLPKAAVRQVVNFLFGEGRFPKISLEVSAGDSGYPALNEEEATQLSKWISAAIEAASIQTNIQAIAERAIATGSAPVVIELIEGSYKFSFPRAQDSWAEFVNDTPERGVRRFVWCYEYQEERIDRGGAVVSVTMMFRREWDEKNVYVFEPVEIKPGVDLAWGTPETKPHGLSFCPVVWIQNEPEYAESIDGISLIADLEDEFEALDMALSRRHQGIIYLGAPQIVETGVEEDDGPSADGRRAGPAGFSGEGPGYRVTDKARRIAPDSVWTYQGKDVDVKMLETSGKAFEVGTAHVNDIRSRVLETMSVVLTSMTDTLGRVTNGAEMSARFLALAHAPLIALVQRYRQSWWPKALRPVLDMMLRMAVEVSASNQVVLVPGTESVTKIASRFAADGQWTPVRMTAKWGRFFDPSSSEIKTSTEAAAKAKDKSLISHETAVEFVAHDYSIDSVEEELREIAKDQTTAVSNELSVLKRMNDGAVGVQSPSEPVQANSDRRGAEGGQNDTVQPGPRSTGP